MFWKDVFLVQENTLKSDLIFLLQRGQRGYIMFMFLCFFDLSSILFCWTDSDVRQTDIYFSEVCFLCFLCILGLCQKLPIGKA
jgi:hypothetical protein